MTVVMNSPAANSKLKGQVTVQATYTGKNFNIATLTVDGVQLASDSVQPIAFSIDTTRVPDGARTLNVAVRYKLASGKYRWEKGSIAVVVENVAAPPAAKPSVPTEFSADDISQTDVQLGWNPNPAAEGVDVYQVYLDDANHKLDVRGLSYVVSGLAAGSTHTFRISAHNQQGYGDWTDDVSVTMPGSVPEPGPEPEPEPPPGTAYFVEDWSSGRFETARWDRLHSYSQPGWFNTPVTASPDGRVSIVADPDGSGKCARIEIRDSDPGYAVNPDIDKSEIVGNATFRSGEVRWFEWDIYLPYNASEKFEWPRGGSQPFFGFFGFHPPGPTGWSAFHLGWEAWQINPAPDANIFLNFFVEGGTFPESTYAEVINLLRLTNADKTRVMANHNRWIKLKWGMRMASDSSGWIECWVDGVNVYPRKNRPTMWAGHDGMYYKYGLYTRHDSTFPGGRSVVYFGRTTIGNDRPF